MSHHVPAETPPPTQGEYSFKRRTFKNVFIDADILLYRSAFLALDTYVFEDGTVIPISNTQKAVMNVMDILEPFTDNIKADHWYFVFSGKANFRKDLCPSYKANRKGKLKPFGFKEVRKELMKIGTTLMPGDVFENKIHLPCSIEADDIIGLLMTHPDNRNKSLALSSDKDFKTIPGWHACLSTKEMTRVSKHDARYYHLLQSLTGDSADGYPGCPKVGKVTAKKILAPFKESKSLRLSCYKKAIHDIYDAYKKQGLTKQDAVLQMRLAKILTYECLQKDGSDFQLFTPPI